MIGPALRDRLTAVYATWLDQDDFGRRYIEACNSQRDVGATSVRQFLEELTRLSLGPTADIERPAALEHPGVGLAALKDRRASAATQRTVVPCRDQGRGFVMRGGRIGVADVAPIVGH